MSTIHRKLRGGSNTAMTQLKQVWREMPEAERERWEDIFVSSQPVTEIRQKIKEELQVNLTSDKQWCRFRDWAEQERERAEQAERMNEDERYWEEQFGKKEAFERARKKLLACSYARALRNGNYESGLTTLRADVRVHRLGLEGRRVDVIEKRAEAEADPDGYLADAKATPEERALRIKQVYGMA